MAASSQGEAAYRAGGKVMVGCGDFAATIDTGTGQSPPRLTLKAPASKSSERDERRWANSMKEGCTVFKEFREFVTRGSVLDLAVGIIMGAAFGAVVNSLVKDVIMPPIGLLLGKVNFDALYLNLSGRSFASLEEARSAGAAVIAYGAFLNAVVSFLIVGFVIFLLARTVNRLRREPQEAPTTRDCPFCLEKVALAATRCPHCTSELPAAEA